MAQERNGINTYWMDSAVEPLDQALPKRVDCRRNSMEGLRDLMDGQKGLPPAIAVTVIAVGNVTNEQDEEEEQTSADPTEAHLGGIVPQDSRLADVRSESCPVAVIFDGLAGGRSCLKETLQPKVLVEPDGVGVTADDSLTKDATGKLAKFALLQGGQVTGADLGDGSDLLERNTSRQPLHAQVLAKISHGHHYPWIPV